MAVNEISLGYYSQLLTDYAASGIDDSSMGPSYGITTVNLGFTDNHGPSYGLSTVSLGFSDNHGPSYSLDASALQSPLPGFIGGKLIHYNEESEVQGKIIFGYKLPVIPTAGQILDARGYGKLAIDIIGDKTIPANEVNALYTNTGAGSLATVTLPPVIVSSGAMVDFVRTSANAFRVAASGTDRIVLPTGDAGVVELTSIGTQLKLISNGITSWLSI